MAWNRFTIRLNSVALSTICAALPIVVLLGTLCNPKNQGSLAAVLGLVTALAVAIVGSGCRPRWRVSLRFWAPASGCCPSVDYSSRHFSVPTHQRER